jgi:hypothetical protein
MMHFLVYSNKAYEPMVESFLISRQYSGNSEIPLLYYTIGFDSVLDYPNLIKVRWEFDATKPMFEYYRPSIMIDALRFSDSICYMDCDILLGKRFSVASIENRDLDYPLCCIGPLQHVWYYEIFPDGTNLKIDEGNLMRYLGVAERGRYVWSSMISYNPKCVDFIEEWDSILNNPYLKKDIKSYFPFKDETAINVLFWKRGIDNFLPLIFFNTIKFESLQYVEVLDGVSMGSDEFDPLIQKNPAIYEQCADSGSVMFYHGLKIGDELDKAIEWMNENISNCF